jgi:hypothetical protein
VVQADEEVKKKFRVDVETVGKECYDKIPITEGKNYNLLVHFLLSKKAKEFGYVGISNWRLPITVQS